MTRPTVPYRHTQNLFPGEPVYDALGKEVKVGDLIAIGVRSGNQGDLTLGRVTGFSTRRESYLYANVRKDEPEYAAYNRWVTDPLTNRQHREYTPNVPDRVVTVTVEYVDPLRADGVAVGTQKGYTTAYNRRFVVVEEA